MRTSLIKVGYHCYAPQPVTLAVLVKAAGLRWTIEENFQAGKGLTGLDEHQVRTWTSWHRWVTFAMLAAAFLTVSAASGRRRNPDPDSQIPLTRNEIASTPDGSTRDRATRSTGHPRRDRAGHDTLPHRGPPGVLGEAVPPHHPVRGEELGRQERERQPIP